MENSLRIRSKSFDFRSHTQTVVYEIRDRARRPRRRAWGAVPDFGCGTVVYGVGGPVKFHVKQNVNKMLCVAQFHFWPRHYRRLRS
jgi:hypothetical protein